MPYQIAFIDDEPTLCAVASTLLPAKGLGVHTFCSWKDFIKTSPQTNCVVCDWHLLEFNPLTPNSPLLDSLPNNKILIISGIQPTLPPGFSFLKKPFRFKTLIDRICAICEE